MEAFGTLEIHDVQPNFNLKSFIFLIQSELRTQSWPSQHSDEEITESENNFQVNEISQATIQQIAANFA